MINRGIIAREYGPCRTGFWWGRENGVSWVGGAAGRVLSRVAKMGDAGMFESLTEGYRKNMGPPPPPLFALIPIL
jgi:hypothetical protein